MNLACRPNDLRSQQGRQPVAFFNSQIEQRFRSNGLDQAVMRGRAVPRRHQAMIGQTRPHLIENGSGHKRLIAVQNDHDPLGARRLAPRQQGAQRQAASASGQLRQAGQLASRQGQEVRRGGRLDVRGNGGFCRAHPSSIDRAQGGCTVRRVAPAE